MAIGLGLVLSLFVAPVSGAELYKRDVYFSAGYERQVDGRTCTAASTAMMLNFIARRDLDLDQMDILRYSQAGDALKDTQQRGSDPLGWATALTEFSSLAGKGQFRYRWEAHTSEYGALKRAAKQIASTGKPVGITVRNGRHAVVMTGFESTRDPRLGEFKLTHVWISDPLGASRRRYAAADSPLNRYLELDATAFYDKAWYRRYVIVVPLLG